MRREADAKVAMRALKRLTEKKRKTDPGGRQSKRKAVREAGKAKAGKKHLEEEGGFGGGSANGPSQSCSMDDTDSESEFAAATGHVPPPDAPADMPAPADRPAKRVRQNQRHGQVWGTSYFSILPTIVSNISLKLSSYSFFLLIFSILTDQNLCHFLGVPDCAVSSFKGIGPL